MEFHFLGERGRIPVVQDLDGVSVSCASINRITSTTTETDGVSLSDGWRNIPVVRVLDRVSVSCAWGVPCDARLVWTFIFWEKGDNPVMQGFCGV